MSRVLLVSMPFSSLRWPALGVSLLAAALKRRGVACDVLYPAFDLAERMGLERYEWINDAFGFVLGGERLFAPHVFGRDVTPFEDYAREVLLPADPALTAADLEDFRDAAGPVGPFLDACVEAVSWDRYAIVGFTTTFQQTLASLALAERIKRRDPAITVAFGGANVEGVMGEELLRQFPQVDLVFNGEADETFPDVVGEILAGRTVRARTGVRVRGDGAGEEGPCRSTVVDLDTLPIPRFDEYFERLARSPLRASIEPVLLFETARGCWWGETSPCAFCGLNGGGLSFRSKGPERAVAELRTLVQRHGVHLACATDNVLDHRYFTSFLPRLREAGLGLALEYELKANLTRAQVEALAAAGVRAAQVGIESLSTPVLRKLRKGANALQNVQALKWLAEAGIAVKWNWLHGVPGETAEDYEGVPELVRHLVHLPPPQAVGRVRIDRFSPYFEAPGEFGLGGVKPAAAYRHVYPFSPDALARLAYYFESPGQVGGGEPARETIEALARWQEQEGKGTLTAVDQGADGLLLIDTRPGAVVFQRRLRGLDRKVYELCDQARSLNAIATHARAGSAEEGSREALQARLAAWCRDGLMAEEGGRYLALALRPRGTVGSGLP